MSIKIAEIDPMAVTFTEDDLITIETELQELLGFTPVKYPLTEHGDIADGYETEFSWESPQSQGYRGRTRCLLSVDRSTEAFYLTDPYCSTYIYGFNQQGYDILTQKIRTEFL